MFEPAPQISFHLPDEPRRFDVQLTWGACPLCGGYVLIDRLAPDQYVVRCAHKFCDYRTSIHRSSQRALKEFRVTAILHQR